MKKKRGILFLVWGESCIHEMARCLEESRFPPYPIFLITDLETDTSVLPEYVTIKRVTFTLEGKVRKCDLVNHLPEGIDTFLFLDVDTRVLTDISLGFDKAEKHGIAMAQAAHYSLGDFKLFSKIMQKEGVTHQGQLLYNSGVVFFSTRPDVLAVFKLSEQLSKKYPDAPWGDQTYLTLAMEILEFNPYTLSTSYNHRAFGELISGEIHIWHSYRPVPENVNEMKPVFPRKWEDGRIVHAKIVPSRKR